MLPKGLPLKAKEDTPKKVYDDGLGVIVGKGYNQLSPMAIIPPQN